VAVRLKVKCRKVVSNAVHLVTVYESDDERDRDRDPWGELKLDVKDDETLSQFQVNQEYVVEIFPT